MSRVRTVFASLGYVWTSLGIAAAVIALAEGAYVGQLALRARIFGSDDVREAQAPGHPYAGQDWYRSFLDAREAAREKYDPWRSYWAYATTSPYLTVDADGYRVTPQPVAPAAAARRIFLLGGSAMWGYTSRDTETIPAHLARRLAQAGLHDVALVNLAQPGYTIGHEIAALQYELARGRRPALAIFYDGINDIRTAQLYGAPGHAFFEQRFGRLFEVESGRGFFASMLAPLERSRLAARLVQAMGGPNPWAIKARTPEVCPALGRYMADSARSVSGLGQAWGFDTLFVQQPHHASTAKRLTAFEATFMTPDDEMTWAGECATAIDTAMAGTNLAHRSYGRLFDTTTDTVFLDRFGHVTEAANDRIAEALAGEVLARLTPAASSPAPPPSR